MSPVETAAVRWWVGKRPLGWTEAEHLKTGAVNTTTATENSLAEAVAKMLSEKKR